MNKLKSFTITNTEGTFEYEIIHVSKSEVVVTLDGESITYTKPEFIELLLDSASCKLKIHTNFMIKDI